MARHPPARRRVPAPPPPSLPSAPRPPPPPSPMTPIPPPSFLPANPNGTNTTPIPPPSVLPANPNATDTCHHFGQLPAREQITVGAEFVVPSALLFIFATGWVVHLWHRRGWAAARTAERHAKVLLGQEQADLRAERRRTAYLDGQLHAERRRSARLEEALELRSRRLYVDEAAPGFFDGDNELETSRRGSSRRRRHLELERTETSRRGSSSRRRGGEDDDDLRAQLRTVSRERDELQSIAARETDRSLMLELQLQRAPTVPPSDSRREIVQEEDDEDITFRFDSAGRKITPASAVPAPGRLPEITEDALPGEDERQRRR